MEGLAALIAVCLFWDWSKKGYPGWKTDGKGRAKGDRVPVALRQDPQVQLAQLEAYKHAVTEKMSVMKAAIEHGWGDDELRRLDARLEALVGKEHLKQLIDGEIPQAEHLQDGVDVHEETEQMRRPVASA